MKKHGSNQSVAATARRDILKRTGFGATLAVTQFPERWRAPIIRTVLLPAHALPSTTEMPTTEMPAMSARSATWSGTPPIITSGLTIGTRMTHPLTNVTVTVRGADSPGIFVGASARMGVDSRVTLPPMGTSAMNLDGADHTAVRFG